MRKLMQYFKGYRVQLVLGPLFKLAEAVLELFVPLLMAQIIDIGIAGGDKQYIVRHGFFMLGLAACGVVMGLICQYFAARVSQAFGRTLRMEVFHHVFSLSAAQCGSLGTDTLITRCTNDVNQVQTGVNMFIRLATRAPFLAAGSIIMALITNWRLGLIFLISTPVIALVLYVVTTKSLPMYGRIQKRQDDISRLAGENLQGVRVIRAFSRQDSEKAQFRAAGDDLAALTVRVGKLSAALNPVTFVVVNLAIVAIIWFGTGTVQLGGMPVGELLAMVNYMNQTLLALIVLANVVVIFNKALASAKRVSDILELQPDMQDVCALQPLQAQAPAVAFNNVSFSYTSGTELAVENISFSLPQGQTMGIIGGTGSGKSTVVKLLQRYFDVTGGAVMVQGVDVRTMPQKQLHSIIGYVPQTATLFSGTIRSNLCLGNQNATEEELWTALEIAQAAEFVRQKPQKLDTAVNEGGKNLSGGQKQRLTIARALVQHPAVLVLDDAASALDYATDAALRKALKTRLPDTTVIMISQRASTIKNASQILVLADGETAGIGTHAQLLQSCEVYREICQSQGVLAQEVTA